MPNGQSDFTFELNESLYFEKGQEVAEMLNISLDPEIAIESFNDYISIRGVVELEGEYEKVVQEMEQKDMEDMGGSSAYRYIERIEDSVEGRAVFSHRFPVEISIPSYRITDINDISVSIDYFDYEIPTENQLKLTSMIKIEGIRGQTKEQTEEEESVDEVVEPEILDQRFEFDVKKEKEQQDEQEEIIAESVLRDDDLEHAETENMATEESMETDEPLTDDEKDRWKKYKETKSFAEFFKKPEEELTAEAQEQQVTSEEELEEFEEVGTVEVEELTDEVEERLEEEEASAQDTVETEEDINYLSDMFRTDEIDQQFTQVRFCIVQEKDTIETIAERYKIPQSKIMKLNMLEDDEIVEGQLLSIPRKAGN